MTMQNPLRGALSTLDNISFPWRATFLIFFVGLVILPSLIYTLLLYIGYLVCDFLDQLQKDRKEDQKRDQALDDEASWKIDPDDPQSETLGGMARVRLPKEHQAIVTRIAILFRRML